MTQSNFKVGNTDCKGYASDNTSYLLIQPVDEHDYESLDSETDYISDHFAKPYTLVSFSIKDWNKELSPWDAPPVFGKESFGSGANDTLCFIEDHLLPYIYQNFGISKDIPVILGGYSLAGLFALWSCYQTNAFKAIAAASPSVWFPVFLDYVKENSTDTSVIYLSLGDKEEKAKNPTMATVGDCIKDLNAYFDSIDITTTLEWNEGNHFKDADIRTAKAFVWCMERINNDN